MPFSQGALRCSNLSSSSAYCSFSLATFSRSIHVCSNTVLLSQCVSRTLASNSCLSASKCLFGSMPRRHVSSSSSSSRVGSFSFRSSKSSFFRRGSRFFSQKESLRDNNTNLGIKAAMVVVFMLGGSYAAVPLYQMFCQHFGVGGTTQVDSKLEKLKDWREKNAKSDREITVNFIANTNFQLPWEFFPTQKSVKVKVGETSLAFFTAKNKATTPIVGIATYNVVPVRAGLYFNKIQCFCFDEQRLLAGEEVDMPVFFFLDPKLLEDPKMNLIKEVTLSYTFFQSSDWDEDDENEPFVPAVEVQRQIEARKLKAEQSNAGG